MKIRIEKEYIFNYESFRPGDIISVSAAEAKSRIRDGLAVDYRKWLERQVHAEGYRMTKRLGRSKIIEDGNN